MVLTVLHAPGLVTVQDLGRVGFAHLGVPRAGALDAPAAALANRLVGNGPAAAVLETTLLGVAFTTDRALTLAVTGAPCSVTVDGRHRAHGEPVTAAAGATVEVGAATSGVRSYVAVAGGVEVAAVLGSRSTDTLAGIGPPRLAPGMTVPVGRPGRPHPVDTVASPRPGGAMGLFPGPRLDWFTAAAWHTLTHTPYVVTGDADRVGVRLRGPVLERRRVEELPSEGLVVGAVQVPPDGQPVVLLADHPVTGGYPVIGVVDTADLARCAQLRPGDEVSFTAHAGGAG